MFIMDNGQFIELCLMATGIIVSFVLSCYAIRISRKSNQTANNANELAKMINSKEYQIYEDLKYQMIQVIAAVRAIDAKAAVALDIQNESNQTYKPNFSLEIDILEKLQSSPGYLIFLNSIVNSDARTRIESTFRNISTKISFFDNKFIRDASHLLIKNIKEN